MVRRSCGRSSTRTSRWLMQRLIFFKLNLFLFILFNYVGRLVFCSNKTEPNEVCNLSLSQKK